MRIQRLVSAVLCFFILLFAASAGHAAYFTGGAFRAHFPLISEKYCQSVTPSQLHDDLVRLHALGFYAPDVSSNPSKSKSVKAAISLFCQRAGIPLNEENCSADIIRELLSNENYYVYPFTPTFKTFEYYPNKRDYNAVTAFTDDEFSKLALYENCSVEGVVTTAGDWTQHTVDLVITSAGGTTYQVRYQYPDRSTRFVKGDTVIVYGTVLSNDDAVKRIAPIFIGLR